MSRRSRRRAATSSQGWFGKLGLGLIVVGVLGAGVLYVMVRGYLYSDGFRRFLSDKASTVAHVDGQFRPFRWDGLAVDTDAFEGSGNGIIKELRMDGLHTEVGVSGLRRGVWEIRGSRLQRLELVVDARNREPALAPPIETKAVTSPAKVPGWLPRKIELQGMEVRDVVVKALLNAGPVSIGGLRVRVEPVGRNQDYRAELAYGTIRLPFGLVPELRMNRAHLRYQDGRIFLNKATAAAWEDGSLEASGEWDLTAGLYALEGEASGVKCGDIFNEDWSKRFIGDMESSFTLDNHSGAFVASGRLTVRNSTLTALPVLDSLAAYADTRRFRVLSLSEAHTDWRWQQGEIALSNLVLASEGLGRLEGRLFIRGRQLDGTFRLGLAPGTLANIPGAESHVFSAGELGLLWTPLRITGTLDDPKEDLTDRLVAAAGLRMFDVIPETGEKVIKFSRSLLGDSPSSAVDQGTKIIEQGSKALQDATGVFDGILGTGKPADPQPDPVKEPVPGPLQKKAKP
jgi:hypothetical protein